MKLNEYEKAIRELFRFLNSNPAELYKDTLEELLEGLEKGYMKNYEKEIMDLAWKNGVEQAYSISPIDGKPWCITFPNFQITKFPN